MLRPWSKSFRSNLPRPLVRAVRLTSSSNHSPNAPLDLDPALQSLLNDTDMSLIRHRARRNQPSTWEERPRRELEIFEDRLLDDGQDSFREHDDDFAETDTAKELRKSPAARFGSQMFGAVVIPQELQRTILRLISESDKPLLHSDAKRLFLNDASESGSSRSQWDASFDVQYKSRVQSARHSARDSAAFASVALPAHYSAVYAVLNHVRRRLGDKWNVQRVIDWGAGTGSGLWASLYTFQQTPAPDIADTQDGPQLSRSTIKSYLGIDKRDGLVSMAKRLLRDVDLGSSSITWKKSFQEDDKAPTSDGADILALSAFMLSSAPTSLARKTLVREMWESGADVIVIIDHNTSAGFDSIARARHYLLEMGAEKSDDPETEGWDLKGCHVVAPCPHDRACPLHHPSSTPLVCGFSQRMQRPEFVRKTKHVTTGHEDIGYSYVVLRRGPRPVAVEQKVGRVGAVGKRTRDRDTVTEIGEVSVADNEAETSAEDPPQPDSTFFDSLDADPEVDPQTTPQLEAALRLEAYSWPRIVFPPLKKSRHVILDSCTPDGKIMRLTIPKSQGKQPYYDARKSSWGDIFPHEPKNAPQERYQSVRAKGVGGTTATRGSDIGKRGIDEYPDDISYKKISADMMDKQKQKRRERARRRASYEEQI